MAGLLDFLGAGLLGPAGAGAAAGAQMAPGLLDALESLSKRAIGSSEAMRTQGTYDAAPMVEAAMLPMGTGMAIGAPAAAGEAILGAGVRPYLNVPESLMGFRRTGPQKGFEAENYRHTQGVEVTLPASKIFPRETFVDEIKGMNADHALERAWRNWPDALHIRALNGK